MAKVDEELEKQKRRREQGGKRSPFRIYLRPGTTKEVIVLDDKPDWFMYEHQLKNPETGRWDLFVGCIDEKNNCPVCSATGKPGYYCLVLSVIDLEPFTTRNGERVEWSRKLMIVKTSQIKKFNRRYKKEGTLRGAVFELSRDGDKDPASGNDIELMEFVDEDELAAYTRSWKDRDGKTHEEDCSVPFDYESIFEEPSFERLDALMGGKGEPIPGSDTESRRSLGTDADEEDEGDWDEDEDEEEKPRGRRSSRSTRTERPTRRRAVEVDEEEEEAEEATDPPFDPDETEDEEDEEEAPRRSRPRKGGAETKRKPRPTRSRSRG